jgi:hypothetical protein
METFHRTFGPEYFSFDYGQVHFIVLDDIEYAGWDTEKDKIGSYRGFITERQLTWLANDLAFVPKDRLVVLSMHIPLYTATGESDGLEVVNRNRVFDLLRDRQHLLALSGHLHVVEDFDFTPDMGWQGSGRFHSVNPGAACGMWWSGPRDDRGIPESVCTDGSPNGFFMFSFAGNSFHYHFYPANRDRDMQVRISSPAGSLAHSDLSGKQIVVNFFAGQPDSKVVYCLDNGAPVEMEFTPQVDPFMERYFASYRDDIPGWLKEPGPAMHTWSAPLPDTLSVGTHKIKVRATDWQGTPFTVIRFFDVTQ